MPSISAVYASKTTADAVTTTTMSTRTAAATERTITGTKGMTITTGPAAARSARSF